MGSKIGSKSRVKSKKKNMDFWFSLFITAALGFVAGTVIGGIAVLIFQSAGVVVLPILIIGWAIGISTGLISIKFGFTNIIEKGHLGTSTLFWGAGCAMVGAVIGGILGTFVFPGLGTTFGALIGAGIGAGAAIVSGFFIRMCVWNCEEGPEIWEKVTPDMLSNIDTSKQFQGLGASNNINSTYTEPYTASRAYQSSLLGSIMPTDNISQLQEKKITSNSL